MITGETGKEPWTMEGYYTSQDLRNGYFQQVQAGNAVFFGELKNGVFDGLAALNFQDGAAFIGTFVQGEWSGPCKRISPNGDFYGYYENHNYSGETEYHSQSGAVYIGPASETTFSMSGQGRVLFPNGHRFEGELKEFQLVEGTLYFGADDDYYEGPFNEKVEPHGEGLRYTKGAVYKGFFKDGKLDGEAIYEKPNGEKFKGNYVDGVIQGFGRIEFGKDFYYEGEFKDGKFDGEGELRQGEGYYKGEFKEGKYHGKGELSQADGTFAKGDFSEGNIDGNVELRGPDTMYVGEMRHNVMHGHGRLVEADGNIYDGEFENGERHGKGVLRAPDGNIVKEGIWNQGKLKKSQKVESKSQGVQNSADSIDKFTNLDNLGEMHEFQSQFRLLRPWPRHHNIALSLKPNNFFERNYMFRKYMKRKSVFIAGSVFFSNFFFFNKY